MGIIEYIKKEVFGSNKRISSKTIKRYTITWSEIENLLQTNDPIVRIELGENKTILIETESKR